MSAPELPFRIGQGFDATVSRPDAPSSSAACASIIPRVSPGIPTPTSSPTP